VGAHHGLGRGGCAGRVCFVFSFHPAVAASMPGKQRRGRVRRRGQRQGAALGGEGGAAARAVAGDGARAFQEGERVVGPTVWGMEEWFPQRGWRWVFSPWRKKGGLLGVYWR
jgi:hypothetical protein